jgi:hypothetical protein
MIVNRQRAEMRGRAMCETEGSDPAASLQIPVQAAIGGKVIARRPSSMRKDVTAKCWRRHLAQAQAARQAEGRQKKMREFGKVEIPQKPSSPRSRWMKLRRFRALQASAESLIPDKAQSAADPGSRTRSTFLHHSARANYSRSRAYFHFTRSSLVLCRSSREWYSAGPISSYSTNSTSHPLLVYIQVKREVKLKEVRTSI